MTSRRHRAALHAAPALGVRPVPLGLQDLLVEHPALLGVRRRPVMPPRLSSAVTGARPWPGRRGRRDRGPARSTARPRARTAVTIARWSDTQPGPGLPPVRRLPVGSALARRYGHRRSPPGHARPRGHSAAGTSHIVTIPAPVICGIRGMRKRLRETRDARRARVPVNSARGPEALQPQVRRWRFARPAGRGVRPAARRRMSAMAHTRSPTGSGGEVAVPRLRVLGALAEHLRAGRVGDAAGGELDAALVDLVEAGPVGRDRARAPSRAGRRAGGAAGAARRPGPRVPAGPRRRAARPASTRR